MKKLITVFTATLAITTFAQEPVYQFSFDDTETMTFAGNKSITIYPLSERAKPTIESSLQKKVKAASHISGIMVTTKNPDMAMQEIMNQISEKTGVQLGGIWSSVLKNAEPTRILMGASKSTTWYFVLSPAPDGDYVLTISYLIEEKNNG